MSEPPPDDFIDLEPDEPPRSGQWIDVHDLLANPTDNETAEGERLGQAIDPEDDEDDGGIRDTATVLETPAGYELALSKARALKTALLTAGVPEVSIELQIGRPMSGDRWNACRPVADFSHHVASYWREGSYTPVLALCKTGRPEVPGPLCNGYGGWDLTYRILCFGLANHPGAGGPYVINGHRIPQDSARPWTWGTEYEGGYRDADWDREHRNPRNGRRMTFREFMGRCNNGLQNYFQLPDEAHMEHSTWAPNRKIDRRGYTRASGIAEIKRYPSPTGGTPVSATGPEKWDAADWAAFRNNVNAALEVNTRFLSPGAKAHAKRIWPAQVKRLDEQGMQSRYLLELLWSSQLGSEAALTNAAKAIMAKVDANEANDLTEEQIRGILADAVVKVNVQVGNEPPPPAGDQP